MRLSCKAALFACIALLASPAAANGLAFEAGGARAHGTWGGELGVGYAIGAAGFKLRPMVGAFIYQGDNDRYYSDEMSNGVTRCRDSQTGHFAKKEKCDDTAVKAYARIEATYTIPLFAEFGVGARFSSEKTRPYGTIAIPVLPLIKIKANAGPKYYALGATLGF